MKHEEVSFSGNTLFIRGKVVNNDYPISDAFQIGNNIVVLYDPDSYTEKFGQFPNLVAFTPDGTKVWTAELPTSQSGDRYYKIASKSPLKVYSIYSHECEIDYMTGKIKHQHFYK